MKVLVTGAKGFIGSHLGNRLKDIGYQVIGIDNECHKSDNETRFEVINEDYRSARRLFVDVDVVFHLAAYINVDESIEKPQEYFDNNALGTLSILNFLNKQNHEVKFIFASSAEVYGSAQWPVIDEDHQLDPLSPYAVSKLAAEQTVKLYGQIYGMNTTVIRNFNTFGEYQRGGLYGGVIAKFAHLGKQGKNLPVYGSGEQSRDYMHISQAIDGYVLALEKDLPGIINFGSGSEVKIIDIANKIAERFNVEVMHEKTRPGELMRLKADVSRAKSYGYNVTTDFWSHLDKYLDHVATS